jgi:hypothetical protein
MMKLIAGSNRKVGQPDYGSRGASVLVEVDVESSLIDRPEEFKDRVRRLFAMCRMAVDEELAAHAPVGNAHVATPGNGHSSGQTNGRRRDGTRKATASQARALHVIADRQGIDLAGLLRQRFGVDQAGDLAITEASQLIDELKGAGNGTGGRR